MKLSIDQIKALKEKMTAAETPEEIADIQKELGFESSAEDIEHFFEKINNAEELSDDILENVTGGFGTDTIPQYDTIKDYYIEKGPNLAFTLCVYFIPSPLCYEIIEVIEDDLRNGK